jgi:small subunit ribosomal protein S1
MEITLAARAGFCKGVKDAMEAALEAARQDQGKSTCTLGPLVHNQDVVDVLAEKGLTYFETPEEIPKGWNVIVRTHGVGPQVLAKLQANDNRIIDATCPIVKHLQNIVKEESLKGRQVIMAGDPEHPEVVGVKGWAGENALIVQEEDNLPLEDIEKDAVIVAQTTFVPGKYEKIVKNIKEKYPHVTVYDTICKSTVLRQEEALSLARQVDIMLIIGSSSSSNTGKLTQLCRDIGTNTYQIASSDEIANIIGWAGIRRVGVTAGASTPDWTIKEVIGKMEKEPEVMGQQDETYEEGVKGFDVGDTVEGKVVQVNPEEVLVDIGYKSEGILPISEIYLKPDETPEDAIKPGDVIEVLVKKVDDEDGTVILSKKSLDKKIAWHNLEKAMAEKTTLNGRVKEAVQAGIIVDMGAGLEGFMPGSLVDTKYIPDFNEFLGKDVDFKVIEINPEKLKVILSRKLVLEEKVEGKKKETMDNIKEGTIITGEVKRLTDFGAFVDVGGIDGLVHISEISWKRIDHPRDVLKVGEEVKVKVLEVIPEKERIGLSLRQALPDPWSVVAEKFKPESIVEGKVTRLVNFGAFVELLPGVEGLAHISQLADYHVKHPQEVLQEGQELKVKILDINLGAKRISLSVKEAQDHRSKMENMMPESDGGSGVTLGDVFGDLFDQDKEK